MLEHIKVGGKVIPLTPVHVIITDHEEDWYGIVDQINREVPEGANPSYLGNVLQTRIRNNRNRLIPLHDKAEEFTPYFLNYPQQFRGRIVLLEAPENGLNPRRFRSYGSLLKKIAESVSCQIIVVTYSPYFLDEFSVEEVTFCRRGAGGEVTYHPLRETKFLTERMGSDFYLGEMWFNLSVDEFLQ